MERLIIAASLSILFAFAIWGGNTTAPGTSIHGTVVPAVEISAMPGIGLVPLVDNSVHSRDVQPLKADIEVRVGPRQRDYDDDRYYRDEDDYRNNEGYYERDEYMDRDGGYYYRDDDDYEE